MRGKLLLSTLLLFFTLSSFSQISPGWFTFDTINSPLQSNFITDLKLDTNNELWVGTSKGMGRISQLDGQFFWEYYSNPIEIPDLWINKIKIDFFNRKWLATADGGVVIFDNFSFTNFNILNSPLTTNRILDIDFDINGAAWIATDGGGLYKLDGNNWNVFNSANTGQPIDIVHTVRIDNLNRKWLGTQIGGLVIYDDNSWTSFNNLNSQLPFNIVRDIFIEKDSIIWLGLGASRPDSSLVTFNGNQTFKVWNEFNSDGLRHTNIWSIFQDSKSRKWFASNDLKYGVALYNDTLFTEYSTNNSGIPNNRTYAVAEDDSSNIWIATFRGLAFFNPNNINIGIEDFKQYKFETYPNPAQNQIFVKKDEMLLNQDLNIILADAYGRVVMESSISFCDFTCSLDVSHLKNGVYFMRIREVENFSSKLIIMK